MKKILVITTLLLFTLLITVIAKITIKDRTAVTYTGLNEKVWIYHFSKPTDNYKVIGTVKAKLTVQGQPMELYKSIMKQVEKDYPGAEGVIFSDWMADAQVIVYTDSK